MSELRKKASKAVTWAVALEGFNRVSGIIQFAILARLLDPKDFGLAAMAIAAIAIMEMMSAPGIGRALIQYKGDVKPYLDSYWSFWLVRSFFISLFVFLLGPIISWYFKEPQAGTLTQWLAPVIFIRALVNPATTLIFRDLTYDLKTKIDGGAQIALFIVTIGGALIQPNVMALIWGQIAREIVAIIMSYVVLSYRPRWDTNWKPLKQFMNFSAWNWGVLLNQFLVDMLDIIVVGRVLPTSLVGIYVKAKNLGFIVYGLSRQLFFKVVFPVYSMIQDEKERCARIFIRSVEVLTLAAIPMVALCFLLARPIVGLVFGAKWLPMVEPLQILFIAGFLRTFQELAATFLQGVGRADSHFRITLANLIPLVILLPIMTIHYGLMGSAWAVLISSLVAAIYSVFELIHQHEYKLLDNFKGSKFIFFLRSERP